MGYTSLDWVWLGCEKEMFTINKLASLGFGMPTSCRTASLGACLCDSDYFVGVVTIPRGVAKWWTGSTRDRFSQTDLI
jgi:hypothetical protein